MTQKTDSLIFTEEEFIKRLQADFNLQGEEGYIIALATARFLGAGYVEGEKLAEKYSDLFCEYCGRLHRGARPNQCW